MGLGMGLGLGRLGLGLGDFGRGGSVTLVPARLHDSGGNPLFDSDGNPLFVLIPE